MTQKLVTFPRRFIPLIAAALTLLLLNLALYRLLPLPRYDLFLSPARSFRLEFDQPYLEDGWYGTEQDSDGVTFKWTRSTDASIQLPLVAQDDLEINFRLHHGDPAYIEALQLFIGNTAIPLERDGNQFHGTIPKSAFGGMTDLIRLTFRTPAVIRANRENPDAPDHRTLGVAFDWLEIRPVSQPYLIEFDAGLSLGEDWYGAEIDSGNGATFRWSSTEDAALTVDIPRWRPFTIEIGVFNAITPEVLQTFRLELNGETLPLDQNERLGRIIYTTSVDPMDVHQITLIFHVDQVISPAELNGSNDQRTLGIRVDWLRITENPT